MFSIFLCIKMIQMDYQKVKKVIYCMKQSKEIIGEFIFG